MDKLDDPEQVQTHADPNDFRIPTLTSTLYRVESGAQYKRMIAWMMTWSDESMHGGPSGREALEVPWDAQPDTEEAMREDKD